MTELFGSYNVKLIEQTTAWSINNYWMLTVMVEIDGELYPAECKVQGQMTVGQLLINVVDKVNKQVDFSRFGLWWLEKAKWVNENLWTLDKVGITADQNFVFTSFEKLLVIQLPDNTYKYCNVHFGDKVYEVVKRACANLGIQNCERLSFQKPSCIYNSDFDIFREHQSKKLHAILPSCSSARQRSKRIREHGSFRRKLKQVNNYDSRVLITDSSNIKQSSSWLDSNTSLMEQGFNHGSKVLLRFKYLTCMLLDQNLNSITLGYIYDQVVRSTPSGTQINRHESYLQRTIDRDCKDCFHLPPDLYGYIYIILLNRKTLRILKKSHLILQQNILCIFKRQPENYKKTTLISAVDLKEMLIIEHVHRVFNKFIICISSKTTEFKRIWLKFRKV
ncbi:hypothetical protein GJ496_002876 [Pomphorhynchus laevis]|nr:hypothetical protein GJ496_002876 [Pomphorhynchus laevis]